MCRARGRWREFCLDVLGHSPRCRNVVLVPQTRQIPDAGGEGFRVLQAKGLESDPLIAQGGVVGDNSTVPPKVNQGA